MKLFGDELGQLPAIEGIEQVGDGWLKKYNLKATLPDGRPMTYEVVSRKGIDSYRAVVEAKGAGQRADAVCVVPFTSTGSLLLIREFRFPVNSPCIAFPAGLKEADESPVECASRELLEETGYDLVRSEDGTPLNIHVCSAAGYSSLGMSDEAISMVFAQVERVSDPKPESTEFIQPFELPRADVAEFLRSNVEPLSIRCQLVLEMLAHDPLAVK